MTASRAVGVPTQQVAEPNHDRTDGIYLPACTLAVTFENLFETGSYSGMAHAKFLGLGEQRTAF